MEDLGFRTFRFQVSGFRVQALGCRGRVHQGSTAAVSVFSKTGSPLRRSWDLATRIIKKVTLVTTTCSRN